MQALDLCHFPLSGQRVIEASAGTGKTYTIAALYLRLILGAPEFYSSQNCPPEEAVFSGGQNLCSDLSPNLSSNGSLLRALLPQQILVVTFTEAATAQLRDRIRARLLEAMAFFRAIDDAGDNVDGFLKSLRLQYPKSVWKSLAWRLDLAAQSMDEAEISTIHAFCLNILARFAFESGHLFQQNVCTQEAPLWKLAARDYWRRCLVTLSAKAFARVRAVLGETPDAILEKIAALRHLKRTDLALIQQTYFSEIDFSGGQFSKNQALPDLSAILAKEDAARTELAAQAQAMDWASLPELLAALVAKKALDGRQFSASMRQKLAQDLSDWQQAACFAMPNFSATTWEKLENLDHYLSHVPMPEHAGLALLQHWRAHWQRHCADQAILAHAFLWMFAHLTEQKKQQAALGFDDMIAQLAAALADDPHLAALLRKQFPAAMIDEFQDTDREQYQIFKTIYGGQKNHALILVGDPKQSIYSFRGAEIDTYFMARRESGDVFTLDKNFRSTEAMVEAINHFFSEANQPFGAPELSFQKVQAQGRDDDFIWNNRLVPAVKLAFVDGEPKNYRQIMAQAAAKQVVAWLSGAAVFYNKKHGQQRPLAPQDIAILVRSHQEAAIMRQALQNHGLRSVYLSERDSIWASDEAAQVLSCLRAVAFDDEAWIREALAASCFGWSWEKLARLLEDDLFREQTVLRFRDRYRQIWQHRGVLAMLRQLWQDEDLAKHCLAQPQGERMLTNLLHLSELAQTESHSTDGAAGLIRRVEQLMRDADAVDSPNVLRLESEDDLVRVVTIHKSKGLEYPLVMLPFVCDFRLGLSGKSSIFLWQDQQQARHFSLKNSQNLAAESAYREAEQREAMRLLYVALTRAQHHLWLGVAALIRGHGSKSNMHEGSFGKLLSGGEPISPIFLREKLSSWAAKFPKQFEFVDLVAAPQNCPPEKPVLPVEHAPSRARIFSKNLRQAWSVSSYSKMVGDVIFQTSSRDPEFLANVPAVLSDVEPINKAALSLHDFPAGAVAGTFLHSILEWIAQEGFATVLQNGALARLLARRCQWRDWTPWQPVLQHFFQQFLTREFSFSATPFALQNLSAGKYLLEMPFVLGVGEVNVRDLDRLIVAHLWSDLARPALAAKHLQGLLKGFVDLVFEHDGQFFVADYKSNRLGDDDAAYHVAAMQQVFAAHRYDLQGVLYVLALHRLLRSRRQDYDYDRDVGGAVFFFLRACEHSEAGVFYFKPPRALIEALDDLFWVKS